MNNPFIHNMFDWQNFFNAIQQGKIFQATIKSSIKGSYDDNQRYEQFIQINTNIYEIYNNVVRSLELSINVQCPECHNNKDLQKIVCPVCHGGGYITSVLNMGTINTQYKSVCGHCNGTSNIFINPCIRCTGYGLIDIKKTFEIKLNPSIKDGQIIVLYEDKYNIIQCKYNIIQYQDQYTSDGLDIHKTLQINIKQAILGGTKILKYVDQSEVEVNIPEGSTNETKVTIPNLGFKNENNEIVGNLIISLSIIIPKGSLLNKFNRWLISKLKI